MRRNGWPARKAVTLVRIGQSEPPLKLQDVPKGGYHRGPM